MAAVAAAGAWLVLWAWRSNGAVQVQLQDDPVLFLQTTLSRFNLGFSPYFPSGWWYLGAEALRAGHVGTALGFFACLSASGLLLVWVLLSFAPGPVYRLWTQWSTGSAGYPTRGAWVAVERLLGFLSPPIRALMMKDLRLLIRDPSQWAQTVFLFGLMGIYVASLRGMAYHNLPMSWRLLVVAANFAAVAGILASLGTRFFFPLPSLEARMAWVVRVAPIPPHYTVWAKVALAMLWTLPPAAAIAAGTIYMLDLPRSLVMIALLDVFLIDLALMSMSVGLGVLLPELGQDEPARIVSGFGGTAALLLGLGYVLIAAVLVWVQVGWIPWLTRAASHGLGTICLGLVSLAISFSALRAAARRVSQIEITG
jgi:ABC-2 type transport system permease protein